MDAAANQQSLDIVGVEYCISGVSGAGIAQGRVSACIGALKDLDAKFK